MKKHLEVIKNHLLTGISYILPLIIGASLVVAVPKIIGIALGHPTLDVFKESRGIWHYLYLIEQVGWTGIGLLNTVLAGFIAYSIADKAGLAPGFIAGAVATSTGSGFLGALVGAFIAGYTVKYLKEHIHLKGAFEQVMPLIIVPFISTGIVAIIIGAILSGPLSFINQTLIQWIKEQVSSGQNVVILALILGAMIAFDMGGPVNKAAWTAGNILLLEGIYTPAVFINCAICIPPLGYAIATFLRKNKFSKRFKDAGMGNIVMGFIGITEGAIPFTLVSPIKLTIINVLGGSIGAGLAALLGARANIPPIGGIYGFISLERGWAYLVGMFVGAILIAFLSTIFVDFNQEEEEEKDVDMDEIDITID